MIISLFSCNIAYLHYDNRRAASALKHTRLSVKKMERVSVLVCAGMPNKVEAECM